jgi:hypothetical protein
MGSVGTYELAKNASYRPQEQQQMYQKSGNDYPPRQYQPPQAEIPKLSLQYPQEPLRGYPEQPRYIEPPPPQYHEVPYSQPTDPRLEMVGP